MSRREDLPPFVAAPGFPLEGQCRDCGRLIPVELWFPHMLAEDAISATLRDNASREANEKQLQLAGLKE